MSVNPLNVEVRLVRLAPDIAGNVPVNLAASITASAREAIRLAAFKAKEMEV